MATMGMQDAVKTVFGKYVDFSGRARRAEYWWFGLFVVIVGVVLSVAEAMMFHGQVGQYGLLSGLWNLATLLPSLAVAVRRMHDTGRSGWWLLLILIPLIGALIVLFWFIQRGTVGTNQYGPDAVN